MLRKLLFLFCVTGLFAPAALAQTGSLSGTVTDAQTGKVIPGANVFIKEIQRGAATNTEGQYSISNIPAGAYTIQVTYVGYQAFKKHIKITGGRNTLNIQLTSGTLALNQLVVTAQQIKHQRRSITTSVTSLSGKELSRVQSTNVVNDFAGKVPGVQVTSQSGTAGGSSRILIRGNSKLTGNTQPLFIVDGMPVFNSNIVGATSTRLAGGAVDVGNRASDINPDDIANVTVLRGASAAALYGQRAQNGVILITTKKGSKTGKTKITVNSSVRSNSALRLPDYQNEYAQGDNGKYIYDNLNGWGPKITGQKEPQFPFNKKKNSAKNPSNPHGGTVKPLKAYPDNVRSFLQNGLTMINNIAVAGGNQQRGGDFRLSLTNTRSGGIIPGNTLHRNNISLNTGKQFNEHLNVRATANYILSTAKGRPIQGGNTQNAAWGTVVGMARTVNTQLLRKETMNKRGEQIPLTSTVNNPFFTAKNNGLNNQVQRFIGSGKVAYSPLKWLTLTARMGIDFYTDDRNRPQVSGTLGAPQGQFSIDRISQRQINGTVLLTANKQLSNDFHLNASLGGNLNTRQLQRYSNTSKQLIVENLFTPANAKDNVPTQDFRQRRLLGAFFTATLGFRDYLFLHVTGRNDITSTLPKDNNSYFYPSAGLSYVFTDGLHIDNSVLSYGKVRASIAEVGSDTRPYQLNFLYFPESSVFGQFRRNLTFPLDGALGYSATNTKPPANLKPQRQISYEFGGELGFFGNRLGLNITYYHNVTRDQILDIPIPQSTGYNAKSANAGKILNKGIEASLDVRPVESQNFQWKSTFIFTRNIQTVESLAPGVTKYGIDAGVNGLRIEARPGASLGLYGTGFKRNEKGKLIINDKGLRETGGEIRLGSIAPDYQLGINNSLHYRNFNLGFLIDISKGGTVVSETARKLRFDGLARETAAMRDKYPKGVFVQKGVIKEKDGTFRKNDVPVPSVQAYYQNLYGAHNFEASSYDASYVKLREVNFGYTLPRQWFQGTGIRDVTISFVGRNLWLIYAAAPDIDPETNIFGSADIATGVEYNDIPTAKSIGGKIHFAF